MILLLFIIYKNIVCVCVCFAATQKEEEWKEGQKGEEVSKDPHCHRWNLHGRNVERAGLWSSLLIISVICINAG